MSAEKALLEMLEVARGVRVEMVAEVVEVLAELHDQTAAKAGMVVVAAQAVAVPAAVIIILVILTMIR
jgi:hypothetical protein